MPSAKVVDIVDWSKIDCALLDAAFLAAAKGCLAACAAHGALYKPYYGFRTYAEQAALYKKFLAGGPRASPPGKSRHEFGKAVDVVRIISGKQDWQVKSYDMLAMQAVIFGLGTGAVYNDHVHLSTDGH